MQRLEVSGAVRPIYRSLGVKGLNLPRGVRRNGGRAPVGALSRRLSVKQEKIHPVFVLSYVVKWEKVHKERGFILWAFRIQISVIPVLPSIV